MMPQTVSVIVPVYNTEDYLHRCISSISNQTYEMIEILIINDGSTDKCPEICMELAETDSRIVVTHQENCGLSSSRNRGIDMAKGDYIAFVDSDDYILPEMIEKMYSFALEHELDILHCSTKNDIGDGADVDEMEFYERFSTEVHSVSVGTHLEIGYKYVVGGRSATAWAKLYKRSFINDNNLRFPIRVYSEDRAFNAKAYMFAKRIGAVSDAYYVYNDRPGSMIYTSSLDEIENSVATLWKLYHEYDWPTSGYLRAYGAVRLVSSTFYNLKKQGYKVERMCAVVDELISKLNMSSSLASAAEVRAFCEYAEIVGIRGDNASNMLRFIKSLDNFNNMLAWQKRYAEVEKKVNI